MKLIIISLFLVISLAGSGQEIVNPEKLPLVPYKPSIYGLKPENRISIKAVFEQGLKVILADTTFKVIQFDVVYDCHSRSLFDFDVKRYLGDKVDPKDEYMRKRILTGDVMDITNTVIEKNGARYRMKDFAFIVID